MKQKRITGTFSFCQRRFLLSEYSLKPLSKWNDALVQNCL